MQITIYQWKNVHQAAAAEFKLQQQENNLFLPLLKFQKFINVLLLFIELLYFMCPVSKVDVFIKLCL